MAKEIERKFLVINDNYHALAVCNSLIEQGYLNRDPDATVRIRIRDEHAFITIKSRNTGVVRDEWEYPIPAEDARDILRRCAKGNILEKCRYIVPYAGHNWEVDEFKGSREGLVVAEVELSSADEYIELPPFVGEEVTDDTRYYNSNL